MTVIGTSLPKQNLEVLDDAFFLEVVDENYFGNGSSLVKGQGMLVLKSSWEIQ